MNTFISHKTHFFNIISFIIVFTLFVFSFSQELNSTQHINTTSKNNTDNEKPFNLTYEMEKAFAEYMKYRQEEEGIPTSKKTNSEEEKTIHEHIKEIEIEESTKEAEARKEKEEWERQVGNFSFSNFITIMVKSHEAESIFENITSVPATLRIAFMVNHPTKVIDFTLSGPLKNGKKGIIQHVREKNYYFIEHTVETPGLFTFFINNYRYKDNAKVTFALNSNSKEEQTIETKSFDAMSKRINIVSNKMNELQMKGNLVVRKIEGHNKSASKHNRSIIILTILEVFVMLMIFIIQSYYLRKLLNKS